MRYLIFNNTPAHVHLYKHAVAELTDRGHEVVVLGRDDSCTKPLLEHFDVPHDIYGRKGSTKASLAAGLPKQFFNIVRLTRAYDPDLIFGRGGYAAFGGMVSGTQTILLLDSVPWRLGYVLPSQFADTVLTTRAFKDDLGDNHYRFNGLTECAYLHPNVYEPDPSVRQELGIDSDEEFALVRFNGFGAFHDVGESGFTIDQVRTLVERLSEHVTVFLSDEAGQLDLSELPAHTYDLHPARIHDVLAAARLFVADAHTMITEAALLGTPAVRATPHDPEDDMGEFHELESFGLVKNLSPSSAVPEAVALLEDTNAPNRWAERRDAYMRDRVDLTSFIVAVAENPDRAGELAAATFDDDEESTSTDYSVSVPSR